MKQFPKYRKALRALRAECPTELPVRVRFSFAPNHPDHLGRHNYGATTRTKGGITITMFRRRGRRWMTDEELMDTIVHEWAHALDWRPAVAGEDIHSPTWGVHYAAAYRATIED